MSAADPAAAASGASGAASAAAGPASAPAVSAEVAARFAPVIAAYGLPLFQRIHAAKILVVGAGGIGQHRDGQNSHVRGHNRFACFLRIR
jgi:hypothetical protein